MRTAEQSVPFGGKIECSLSNFRSIKVDNRSRATAEAHRDALFYLASRMGLEMKLRMKWAQQ